MNSKLLKISGSLLIVSVISAVSYLFMLNGGHNIDLSVLPRRALIFSFPLIIISLYCFGLNNTKAGNIVYYAGFGIYTAKNIWSMIQNFVNRDYSFDLQTILYFADDFVFLSVLIFFVLMKIKPNKSIAIIGGVFLGIYTVSELFILTRDLRFFPSGI